MPLPHQAFQRPDDADAPAVDGKASRTGSFIDNMKLPVHRWFRYSAGFSAQWVENVIRARDRSGGVFFDPFAGSGTSLLAAEACGMRSAGAEAHSFVARIASAKLAWRSDPQAFATRAAALLDRARCDHGAHDDPPASTLLVKCYDADALSDLDRLRRAFLDEPDDDVAKLLWLAITAILRECSGVGTAQWQYVLPSKTKARVARPFDAFERRVALFGEDMASRAAAVPPGAPDPIVLPDDARSLGGFADLVGRVDLVITSPPYPNNFDYADATRLEMTFWREIAGWGDLQRSVRHRLVRSCSQHSAAEKLVLDDLLENEAVAAIRNELTEVCDILAEVRETRGGRKTYHTMVAAYFNDLALTWRALRRLCVAGADVCFVIGDSAPYGVHVPAERWLATLAQAEGFTDPRFEKIRDRNLKWKNRKHRVPLQEGNLWVRG